jgi:hypothetical protein
MFWAALAVWTVLIAATSTLRITREQDERDDDFHLDENHRPEQKAAAPAHDCEAQPGPQPG